MGRHPGPPPVALRTTWSPLSNSNHMSSGSRGGTSYTSQARHSPKASEGNGSGLLSKRAALILSAQRPQTGPCPLHPPRTSHQGPRRAGLTHHTGAQRQPRPAEPETFCVRYRRVTSALAYEPSPSGNSRSPSPMIRAELHHRGIQDGSPVLGTVLRVRRPARRRPVTRKDASVCVESHAY